MHKNCKWDQSLEDDFRIYISSKDRQEKTLTKQKSGRGRTMNKAQKRLIYQTNKAKRHVLSAAHARNT